MKRTLIGLASVALLSLSSSAFAASHRDQSDTIGVQKNGTIILAQANAEEMRRAEARELEAREQAKRKSQTDADKMNDTSGTSESLDATQSKRGDSDSAAESGSH
jgi:opacity protein-like surface antigen